MCGCGAVYPQEVVPMNGTDENGRAADRALWLRSQATDAPDDADGRLEGEETERIAALIAADPEAASDVVTARVPLPKFTDGAALERVIARACGLVMYPAPERGRVLLFARPNLRRGAVRGVAEWASLAAALAMVGWFGFAMGSDASLALGQPSQPS